ncbi:MAG: arginase family protein, partial [Elusimicrobiota bacterium]
MINRVYEENIKFYRDSKFPVVIGGEHTVSIGSIKACSEFFKKVSILHLDAHSDFRDSYRKDPYSHACVMARVSEFNPDIVSAGIRSMDFCEKKKLKPEKTVYAHEAFQNPRWEEKLLNALGDNVYLDIDLDVFDPSVIPATGTPEPGGLLWYQVTGLISKIARRKNIRGLSVVELCPLENNRVSEFNAAVLIYKTLSYLQSGR